MSRRRFAPSAKEFRRLFNGSQTQIRRMVADQSGDGDIEPHPKFKNEWFQWDGGERLLSFPCPFGIPGDELIVLEDHKGWIDTYYPEEDELGDIGMSERAGFVLWRHSPRKGKRMWLDGSKAGDIDLITFLDESTPIENSPRYDEPWSEANQMPEWASRLTLVIKSVRVERLTDISLDDIDRAGVPCGYRCPLSLQDAAKYRFDFKNDYGLDRWDGDRLKWFWVLALEKK